LWLPAEKNSECVQENLMGPVYTGSDCHQEDS